METAMDDAAASDYKRIRDYLYALRNQGSRYGIERMRAFSAALNAPERRFPSIHVAGSNGKGSVCALLESIYRQAGYRTGLYTSPHLIHLGERVQVNRCPLNEAQLIAHIRKLRPIAETLAADDPEVHPSFFEFMTAAAFLTFAETPVDIALIETGLGGRLDATNILQPELCIITSIALEHTEILGQTLAAIAREKAGIIKPGVPVLTGPMDPEAEAVIAQIASERDAPWIPIRSRYANARRCPRPALAGVCQRWNAAMAVSAVDLLRSKFPVSQAAVKNGLKKVEWNGRWQVLTVDGRTLILDATHNAGGIQTLRGNLQRLIQRNGCRPHIITGMLGLERANALLPLLAHSAASLQLVTPNQPKATPTEELLKHLPAATQQRANCAHLEDLIPQAGQLSVGNKGDTIVATGSLYLLGEILQRLSGQKNPLSFQDQR